MGKQRNSARLGTSEQSNDYPNQRARASRAMGIADPEKKDRQTLDERWECNAIRRGWEQVSYDYPNQCVRASRAIGNAGYVLSRGYLCYPPYRV